MVSMTGAPPDVDRIGTDELRRLLIEALGKVAGLAAENAALREEIARLKGLKGRPSIKPCGMEQASEPKPPTGAGKRRGRGSKQMRRVATEDRVLRAAVPAGSRFKGYESFFIQDLVLRPLAIRFRRERWVARRPHGGGAASSGHRRPLRAGAAPVRPGAVSPGPGRAPAGGTARGHRYRGFQTAGRAALDRPPRAVPRRSARGVACRAGDGGLGHGRRHRRAPQSLPRRRPGAANGYCTQIGNEHFTWFGTTGSKSRRNFLELLRAGHADYVINTEALAYMRGRSLARWVILLLAEHDDKRFADRAAWLAHLRRLGIAGLDVTPDPVKIATEGALWGSINAHGFLKDTVILSDDAGQFDVARHALCWVHAERLVHKLDAFTDRHRAAQQLVRSLIWWLYRDLKAYCRDPTPQRESALRARFDWIFQRRTGFDILDRLLARLYANKPELLMVLERPEIPLHTNGSENDIRCHVTRRKISGGTRSDPGRDCRDAFLGLAKTCGKLGISFWDYLGARLSAQGAGELPFLPDLVKLRSAQA